MIRTRLTTCLLALLLLLPALAAHPAASQPVTEPAVAVDLASVPLPPADLPERGFQLVQAGFLDLDALAYAIAGDGQPATSPFADVEDVFTRAYSYILALLGDRDDPSGDILSGAATYIIGFATDEQALEAAIALTDLIGLTNPTVINDIDTYSSPVVITGLTVSGTHIVLFNYSFDEQRFSTRQNTDWTPEVVAEVVETTAERLDTAIDRANNGEAALANAGLLFTGPDALWTMPWTWFPNSQHYRVLNGVPLPYGGEMDTSDVAPDGVADLYVSRQQLGDDGYDHMLDVTLASFDDPASARAFAADPGPITFPPTWVFEAQYGSQTDLEAGLWVQTVRVEDDWLRATGFRTVRVVDTTVQVVQWLASEHGLSSRQGILDLTAAQSACLDALPAACTPLPQEAFPAPYDAESAASGDYPDIGTPIPQSGGDNTLASIVHGWSVALPDDGWQIVDVEFLAGTEYYQVQSGRSLLTIESVIDRAVGPDACLLDEVSMLEDLEERAVITLGSDDPAERQAGLERDRAWGVYTVEPLQEERADQEYTIRIDCYTLVPGEISLVVTHTAPRELWIEERDKGERFRAALTLPDPSTVALATTPPAGDRRPLGRTLTWA